MGRPFRVPGWRRRAVEQQLRNRLVTLTDTIQNGRTPDSGTLEEVESLRRLLEVQSSLRGRWRYPTILIAGILSLVVGLMLLRQVETLEVEGSIRASALQLTLSDRRVLPLDKPLRALAASGFTKFEGIPLDSSRDAPKRLRIDTLPGGSITLQQITLPEWARLNLEQSATGRTSLRVEQGGAGGQVRIATDGAARLVFSSEAVVLRSGDARTLLLDVGQPMFSLSFTPSDSTLELLTGLRADSLSFSDLQMPTQDARNDVVLLSTIDGGELYFPEMRGEKVTLRAREQLHMQTRALHINRLKLEPQGFVIEFRALISDLALGEGDARRDLRPSLLEWYAANRRLELARTVFVSGLVMALGILAWWNGNR